MSDPADAGQGGGGAAGGGSGAAAGRRVLVALSAGAPPDVVAPVTAALLAEGLDIRRVDLGRIGTGSRTLDRVMHAILGEAEQRRLDREVAAFAPDVAVAFEPGAAAALVRLRDRRESPAPVVAVVPELAPRREWVVDADRYAALDDEAAVALADHGADGARVIVTGLPVARARVEAGREDRATLRARFKLPSDVPVVLVAAAGLARETLSQILIQLALFERRLYALFDAGDDADAAAHLRQKVPGLGLRGKLFGEIADAPLLWRAADLVIARPTPRTMLAALAAGCAFMAVEPAADREAAEARALAERGAGVTASKALVLAAALESLFAEAALRGACAAAAARAAAGDGASNVARLVAEVAADREAVLAETFAAAAERAAATARAAEDEARARARRQAPAVELEDLGGEDDLEAGAAGSPLASGPDRATLQRLRAEIAAAEARARKELDDARAEAEKWDQRRVLAERKGDAALAADAAREADRKRARMHGALEELSRLAAEKKRLAGMKPAGGGATVDEMLDAMKQDAAHRGKTVDEELAALKRRMETERKGRR